MRHEYFRIYTIAPFDCLFCEISAVDHPQSGQTRDRVKYKIKFVSPPMDNGYDTARNSKVLRQIHNNND